MKSRTANRVDSTHPGGRRYHVAPLWRPRFSCQASPEVFEGGNDFPLLPKFPVESAPSVRSLRPKEFHNDPTDSRKRHVTAQLTLKALAKEFSIQEDQVQGILEMMDAGLLAPFIARVRRSRTGGLTEYQLRRLQQRRDELVELDRRRGTILRQLEKETEVPGAAVEAIQRCADRFELEDLYVPHRRPEPEVQLAMDRGLTPLAEALIQTVPKELRSAAAEADAGGDGDDSTQAEDAAEAQGDAPEVAQTNPAEANEAQAGEAGSNGADANEAEEKAAADAAAPAPAAEDSAAEIPAAESAAEAAATPEAENASAPAEAASDAPTEPAGEAAGPDAEAPKAAASQVAGAPAPAAPKEAKQATAGSVDPSPAIHLHMTEPLRALCKPFVNPDRGIHTEEEALSGAVRILSDRLGRNAALRTNLRRMLRKRSTLKVQPNVPVDKMGRHKNLAKFQAPLKQVQGHRLIALRQAQRERVLSVQLQMDAAQAVNKVRQALGRHTHRDYDELLQEIARRAYHARLLPVIEADVRLELKERSDTEALRFLSNHLRQLLFTPTYGRRPVVGVDVSAKGDWVLAAVGPDGAVQKTARIEVGGKDDAALLAEWNAALEGQEVQLVATGHDKRARAGAARLRKVLSALEADLPVTLVNEAGLGSYANSELARQELEALAVPERMAVSLGRRLQDPMAELLKVDPRHLSLGSEQGLVSKANLKRALDETVDSCVALIGCDVNMAPKSVLAHVPGLDEEAVQKILAARAQGPIASREALRQEGLLSEVQWTNAAGFLRVPNSPDPLDRTYLHPELYATATALLQSAGGSVEESLGRPGVTKGLKREAHSIDEHTWRDLMRELSRPGRDPRSFLMRPRLMAPDTDPARLTEGRVVEGIVTSVASFGAFIDVGLAKDAIVHISQISSRYIRDARELLSIGQVVRARITDPAGQRMTLSLKDVPAKERAEGGGRRRRAGRGRGRGRGRGADRDPRAGLRKGDARGMRLGGAKVRRGGGKKRGDSDRNDGRNERVDLRKLNANPKEVSSSPFAKFFGKDEDQKDNQS